MSLSAPARLPPWQDCPSLRTALDEHLPSFPGRPRPTAAGNPQNRAETERYTTWLIVKSHRAYIQGVGILNGVGGHKFVITVIDNQGHGDRFGMRVISGNYTTVNQCTFGPVTLISGHAAGLHK